MKVKMLVDTAIAGGYAHAGDAIEVEDETAARWIQYGIAEVVTSETQEVKKASVLESESSSVLDVTPSSVPERKKAGRPKK